MYMYQKFNESYFYRRERILEKSLENHSTIAVKFDRFPFGISLHTDDTLNPLSITS